MGFPVFNFSMLSGPIVLEKQEGNEERKVWLTNHTKIVENTHET